MTPSDEKPVGMRQADQDIHYIRTKLDEFIGVTRTPMRIMAWTMMAMVSGIAGAIGLKFYAVLCKLLSRLTP